MLTQEQIERLALQAMKRGVREGGMIADPARTARLMHQEIAAEPVCDPGRKQWMVVYHGANITLTFRAFGADVEAASRFAAEVGYNLIGVRHCLPQDVSKTYKGQFEHLTKVKAA